MATIVYKNAQLLIAGRDVSAQLHDLTVNYGAEILDETRMGDDTRRHKGGLLTASMAGTGFADFSADLGQLMWDDVGIDDVPITVFPDGVTVGTACGFSMKAVDNKMDIGGTVGAMLDIKFQFDSRGVAA